MERRNGHNTCLTDSVAYIAKIPEKDVPFFIGRKMWTKALARWSLKYGRRMQFVWYNTGRARKLEKMKKLYIAVGQSPRSKAKKPTDRRALTHAVVKRGNKYIYDSSPSNKFIKSKPLFYIEFVKVKIATARKGKGTKQGQYDKSKQARERGRDIKKTAGKRKGTTTKNNQGGKTSKGRQG